MNKISKMPFKKDKNSMLKLKGYKSKEKKEIFLFFNSSLK